MNRPLAILCFLVGFLTIIAAFPEGIASVAVTVLISGVVIFIIQKQFEKDSSYLIQIFLIALIARLIFGLVIHIFDIRGFFGGDAATYDMTGNRLIEIWFYDFPATDVFSQRALATNGPGWGMNYLVGVIYSFTGQNILAAQSFCAVFGAATVPMIYNCAYKIFGNRRVGQISALLVALYPAFIVWTGQLLKDGLIIFLLVLSMTVVIRLQEKLRYLDIVLLVFSLFAIISLRFYIFYMVALTVIGAFVVGTTNSPRAMIRRIVALSIIGLSLTYFGVSRSASDEFEKFGSLERVQLSRQDLARSAESGYGEDLDVSTTGGAIAALPIGLAYLLLAPFPWQITNFRQLVTLPEVLLWWSSIPFMISGLLYTIRHRLRKAVPILVFSLMLTLAYSVFSGNVGTAYRQRTQIQVFLFMFIAVGWAVREEKKENRRIIGQAIERQIKNAN